MSPSGPLRACGARPRQMGLLGPWALQGVPFSAWTTQPNPPPVQPPSRPDLSSGVQPPPSSGGWPGLRVSGGGSSVRGLGLPGLGRELARPSASAPLWDRIPHAPLRAPILLSCPPPSPSLRVSLPIPVPHPCPRSQPLLRPGLSAAHSSGFQHPTRPDVSELVRGYFGSWRLPWAFPNSLGGSVRSRRGRPERARGMWRWPEGVQGVCRGAGDSMTSQSVRGGWGLAAPSLCLARARPGGLQGGGGLILGLWPPPFGVICDLASHPRTPSPPSPSHGIEHKPRSHLKPF